MKKYHLAIIGATGLVGETLLKVLIEENLLDNFEITMFGSEKSTGKIMIYAGKEYRINFLNEKINFKKFDLAFFLAGDEISKKWANYFSNAGAFVIDNSNAFRRENFVPLVVPEINVNLINEKTKIIANPNCSTIELVLALSCIKKVAKIKRVVVSTYQSVSGAGKEALFDLKNKTKLILEEGISNNLISYIGKKLDSGFCTEEDKIMFETSKILGEEINLCASTVRVPITNCHLESVFVEFEEDVLADEIKGAISGKNIFYSDEIVLPTDLASSNDTFVFRMRQFGKREIVFFVLADNLRRGASFNAVLIAKHLLNKNFFNEYGKN